MTEGWTTTLETLRNRNFRWLWFGRLASSGVFQMSQLAQGWLVYELTGSALWLGWVSSAGAISSLLFSLYGGVIVDRVVKRDLLLWARIGLGVNTLIIAVLISAGQIRIWHLLASSLSSGLLFCFVMPAEQAIVAELVDGRTLLNAMALNSIAMGLMGTLSASVAGFSIEAIGLSGVYYLMVALYTLAIFAVAKLPHTSTLTRSPHSVWADLREGLGYVTRHSTLLVLLALSLAWALFGTPYRTFLPKFSKEVLGMEAGGLGLLMAAQGVGGLLGSFALTSLGDSGKKGKLLIAAGVSLGVSLSLFASVRTLPLVLLFLALAGAASNACMVTNNTLLQVNCETRFRGRLMSMWMMTWGLTPLGTLPGGALADRMGVPFVVVLQGTLMVIVFLAIALLRPDLRELR